MTPLRGPGPLVSVVVGLATGALLYSLGTLAFGKDIFPTLPDVAQRLAADLADPAVWGDLGLTLGRTAGGFLLAFGIGLPLGLVLGRSVWTDAVFFLPVVLLQACPPLFWVIPLVLLLGTDGQAPTAVVFLVVLPLVTLAVRESRKSLTPTLQDVFRIYAPSRWLIARELLVPALGPALRSSLVLGVVLGLKSAVLGEWFGSHTGLGRAIYRLYGVFDMGGFFALVFLFLAVGSVLGLGSEALGRVLFPARRPTVPGRVPGPGFLRRTRPVAPLAPGRLVLGGVDFRWGPKPLLKGVDLSVGPGETVVLVGPSGSGKTTLARVALGLIRPQAGRVLSPERPAVLFQDDGLLAHRDVLGNVLLPAWYQATDRAEARARDLITRVGLGGEEAKFPDELSGGMRKRAALARALMQDPDFVVFDEPFQNLDEASRQALWDLTFGVLADRGIGALVITHYPRELEGRPVRFWTLGANAPG
ncbi:MAG TPA: ATP-binding cassette domain-containing protein [Spirochaetia bacterium]|nr:ATP-binding cassette domain-containing protein [Spirochaetia bacterium]